VASPQPVINTLTPNVAQNGSGNLLVTINGANFLNGAQVFWNGVALPTTFVNGSQLTAQVAIGATGQPQQIGVAVVNPDPDGQSSNTALFTVQASSANQSIFLPQVLR
jgi:hypothetical protein